MRCIRWVVATTIRVADDVKEEFARVQGLLQARTGERLSQSEVLARLLRVARTHERELLEEDKPWEPPTPKQIERFLDRLEDVPVETDSSRIDEVLYGGEDA